MKREKKEMPARDIQSIFGTEKKGPSKFFGFIQRDIFFYPFGYHFHFHMGKLWFVLSRWGNPWP